MYLFKLKNKWKLSYSAGVPVQHFDYHIKRLCAFHTVKFLLKFYIDSESLQTLSVTKHNHSCPRF